MLKTFYIFSSATLSRKENMLCLITREQKNLISIVQVEQIYVFNEVALNTKLLNFLSQNGVLLHFFNFIMDIIQALSILGRVIFQVRY